ncbi:MAG: serpin family protein [Gammaproteobacteria bacterium]|nr:serpin family protein [Gammaproteobacteria bacterium]
MTGGLALYRWAGAVAASCALLLSVCASQAAQPTVGTIKSPPANGEPEISQYLTFLTALATDEEANLILSPSGIGESLQMLAEGVDDASQSQLEGLVEALGQAAEHANGTWNATMQSASLLVYSGISIRESYQQSISSQFAAITLVADDIERRQAIENELQDRLKTPYSLDEMLSSAVGSDINIISLNAFENGWSPPFDPALTSKATFFNRDGGQSEVDMMSRSGMFALVRSEGLSVVEVPYHDSEYSALFGLPDSVNGNRHQWEQWLDVMDRFDEMATYQSLQLKLPRFSIAADLQLNDQLEDAGITAIFDPRQVSLERMFTPAQDAFVGPIAHRAYLEIDEDGTKAGSATIISIFGSLPEQPAENELIFNKPFWMAIREHRSGTIHFLALVRTLSQD